MKKTLKQSERIENNAQYKNKTVHIDREMKFY